jgi:hypothetical protein
MLIVQGYVIALNLLNVWGWLFVQRKGVMTRA